MMKLFSSAFLRCCVFAIAASGLLSACDASSPSRQPSSGPRNITVVFIPKLTGNAFFESANEGSREFAKKHGFTVEYKGSPQASVDRQAEIVRDAVARKVDAICISSLDATALDEELKKAMAAGVVVVTWDSDVSPDARMLMVSQGTPEQLGGMLVEMGAKSLEERGINPVRDAVSYVWHYSQASVTDQNSWRVAGEAYIRSNYPKWKNVAPENYYSEQDPEKALRIGKQILAEHPGINLIFCNDSTSLPGQAEAMKSLGLTQDHVTVTGFASPLSMRAYAEEGVVRRWGLWDCRIQGALGCYIAWYLAAGNSLSVGDRLEVPDIGTVEVMPNAVLAAGGSVSEKGGVILLPDRLVFTRENAGAFNF